MNDFSIGWLAGIGIFVCLLLGGAGIYGFHHAQMPPIPKMQRPGQPLP